MSSQLPSSLPLITRENGSVPRDRLLGYLNDCVDKLNQPETIEMLVLRHLDSSEPLFQIFINYQREM
jgi:hypothetical protein